MTDPNIWSPNSSDQLIRDTLEFMKGTSLTSVTIVNSGSVTFTVETERYFYEGNFILAVNVDDFNEWMIGQVTSYDALTGELVLDIKTSNGTGTIANWLIYLNAAWKELQFTGGVVSAPITFDDTVDINGDLTVTANVDITGNTTQAGNIALTGDLDIIGNLSSTAGDLNTLAYEVLADADATLTAAQIYNGILYINPTAARTLTMPTAASILALLTDEITGSHFQFTIINPSDYQVTVAGNTDITTVGKLTVINGSITFKCRVEDAGVVRLATIARGGKDLVADNSTDVSVSSSAVDITLTASSARLQHITMTALGKSVKLPDAMTMRNGTDSFIIFNAGTHPIGIKDYTGTLLVVINDGGSLHVSLASNATQAGTWMYTGSSMTHGHLIASAVYDSPTTSLTDNYQDFVNLDSDKSLHFFYGTASDLRVIAYDAITNAFGTEVLITGTTVNILAVYKVTTTTAIVFYSESSSNLRCVIVSLSGSTTLAVGTAANAIGASKAAVDDNQGAPKIIQLDSDLYFVAYALTGNNTFVRGIKVYSGTSIVIGNDVVVNNNANEDSTTAYKLSTLSALVLYKKNAGTPYINYGVVVDVTNANPPVCTVNTSYALTNCSSSNNLAPSSVLLSTSSVVILDDNNTAGDLVAQTFSISGSVLTVGTAVTVDTSQGTSHSYTDSSATRYTPHLFRLSDTTALCWYRPTSGPRRHSGIKILTNTAGVMSAGTKLGGSFGIDSDVTKDGFGIMLPQSINEFVGLVQYTTNNEVVAIPHKISGSNITVGKAKKLGIKVNDLSTDLAFGKTASGIYFITSRMADPVSGGNGMLIAFKSDGDNIYDYCEIPKYQGYGADSNLAYIASNGNKAIYMERTPLSTGNFYRAQVSCFELAS